MLEHGHKPIKPLPKPGGFFLAVLLVTLGLPGALAPLFEKFVTCSVFLPPWRSTAQKSVLTFQDNIREPMPLAFYYRDNHVGAIMILKTLTNCEKVTFECTIDTQRGSSESVDPAAYLHVYPLAEMRVCSTITGGSLVQHTRSVCGFG